MHTSLESSSKCYKLFLLLFLGLQFISVKAQWTKVYQKSNISVYQKDTDDGFIYYKAQTIFNVSIDSLYSFFIDFQNYPNWVNYCSSIEVIESVADSMYIYYSYFDMPWPARNRDAISILSIEKGTHKINVVSRPSKVAYKDRTNTIRVSQFEEKYELIEISEYQTRFIMQGTYDPGGLIPDWTIRKMLKYGPYDVLTKVKAIVETH